MNNTLKLLSDIVLVLAKEAGKEATPTAIILLHELGGLGVTVIKITTESELTAREKSLLYASAITSLQEALAVAEEEGLVLASDIPGILAAALSAEVKNEIGIH